MSYQFNPPPGWPAAARDWIPLAGWQPDAAWPAAPPQWRFWVPASANTPVPQQAVVAPPAPPAAIPTPAPAPASTMRSQPATFEEAIQLPYTPPTPFGGWLFNSPPGWPLPAGRWQPAPGWEPDAAWLAAPSGWEFWSVKKTPFQIAGRSPVDKTRTRFGGGGTTILGIAALAQGGIDGIMLGITLAALGIAAWGVTGFGRIPFVILSPGRKWIVAIGAGLGVVFLYTFFICFFMVQWTIAIVASS